MPERTLRAVSRLSKHRTAEQPDCARTQQRTAFIGRTLRGPLDTPVLVLQLRRLPTNLRRVMAAEPAIIRR